MRAGEVLSEAWTMYRAHGRHLLSISFAFYVLLFGISLLLALLMGDFGQLIGALVAFIIFAIRWSLLVPVLMLEKRTVFGSLDRSQELVSGHTGQAFVVLLFSLGFVIAVSILVAIVLAPFDLPRWLDQPIRTIVAGTLIAPFAALALTLMYYRLRGVKEPVPAPEPVPAA
jgi:hypothetical protein